MADIDLENISDEDFLKLSEEQVAALTGAEAPKAEETEVTQEETTTEVEETQEEVTEEATTEETVEETTEVEEKKVEEPKAADVKPDAKADDKAKVEAPKDGVNFEAEYKKITAPFKANGKDFQVKSVDEAVDLMRMGANYSKKMAGLKPHLTTIRMLEDAKIGAEELSFLIDLHKGDTGAINKLVSDRKIDPMDLSADKAGDYKSGTAIPTETDVELDATLRELEGSEGYARTIQIVGKDWDNKSRSFVQANPGVLRIINGHVENGVYEIVAAEVERERTLGRLASLSDLDAYKLTADKLHAAGVFKSLNSSAKDSDQEKPNAPAVVKPEAKKVDDSKRNEQKKAAAPTKGAPAKTIDPNFNPLSMSDEDFKNFKF